MEGGLWNGPDRVRVKEGSLRLLSAREVLDARREGDGLARDGRERAVCRNACLIAKALERHGRAVFEDGQDALNRLRVEDIARLSDAWAAFNREHNPSALDGEREIARRKKDWSTRLMSAFSGACSGCSALCPPRRGQKP